MTPHEEGVIITQEKAIELLVYKTVKKVFAEEREALKEEYKMQQEVDKGRCVAYGMFKTDDKKEDYYIMKNSIEEHLRNHGKREALVKWIIGISTGSIAYNIIKVIWEYIHRPLK